MGAAKTKQTPPPAEPYTNIEMRLVCASKIKIVKGEHAGTVIDWDANMLRVYLYLFNQVKGFENSGGEFYQSQDKIRLSTGLGKTKLNEVLDTLKMLGLICKTGKKTVKGAPRGLIKYTAVRLMDVIGTLEIIFADDNGEQVWDHERASGKKVKKSNDEQDEGKSEPASPGDVNEVNPAKPGCTEMQAEQAKPTGENVGQRERVASDNDSGSEDRIACNHAVKQQESQECPEYDDDPPFPPKKPASDDAPEGFTPPGEIVDGELVEGEPLGHDEICEKAGAG